MIFYTKSFTLKKIKFVMKKNCIEFLHKVFLLKIKFIMKKIVLSFYTKSFPLKKIKICNEFLYKKK